MKSITLNIFFLILVINLFGQNKSETLEIQTINDGFETKTVNRRSLVYDENLNITNETYYGFEKYSNRTKVIGNISYDTSGKITRITTYINYPQKYLEIDFRKGHYFNYKNGLELKFKENFLFEGVQKGKNIVVNYRNGLKNGICVQSDSGVIYNKNVIVQKPNLKLLQFDIIKFSNQIQTEPVFQLFNGLVCSFKDNMLNGEIKGYYLNGNYKLESFYKENRLINYTSYNKEKLIINKIPNTNNGFISGNIIHNGVLNQSKKNYLVINKELNKVGDIYETTNNSFFESDRIKNQIRHKDLYLTKNVIENKKKIDELKVIFDDPDQLLYLLQIPIFEIRKLESNDENLIKFINTNENYSDSSITKDIIDNISFFDIRFFKESTYEGKFYSTYSDWSEFDMSDDIGEIRVPRINDSEQKRGPEGLQILLDNINHIICYSILLKNNINIPEETNLNNWVNFYEGNGPKIRFYTHEKNKYVEIFKKIEKYPYKETQYYSYFDGNKKYNFEFKIEEGKLLMDGGKILLTRSWIE